MSQDDYIREIKIDGQKYEMKGISGLVDYRKATEMSKTMDNVLVMESWGNSGNNWWRVYELKEKKEKKNG